MTILNESRYINDINSYILSIKIFRENIFDSTTISSGLRHIKDNNNSSNTI